MIYDLMIIGGGPAGLSAGLYAARARLSAAVLTDGGGQVTGVIPRFMVEQGWHHTGLTELQVVDTMHERKQRMASLADAAIALPGGCGTLEELLELITWKQLGIYLNPIVVLNTKGYYDPLLAQLAHAVDEHFMGARHAGIWQVARTPVEAVEAIHNIPLWNPSIRKFAAL